MGPKGTGLLYIRKQTLPLLHPTFVGAYTVKDFDLNKLEMHYEKNAAREEYGTRNAPISNGIKRAVEFIEQIGIQRIEERGRELADYLKKGLSEIDGVVILSPSQKQYSSAIVTFKITHIDYLEVQKQLGSNHHCRVRGIYENGLNAIRISCGIYLLENQLDQLINGVKKIAER